MGSAVLAPSTFVVVSFLLSLFSLGSLQAFTTTCPFNCSSLGQIDFPFSDTSNPNCGLCTMDCTDNKPKIQFKKKGKWYNVEQMDHDNRTIEIYDPEFKNTLVSSYCHLLDNFTAKESPLSFEVISRRFYFVKCKREGTPTSLSESFPWSQNFKDCKDYDIFFNWFTSEIIPIIPNYLSNRCSVVQLPVKKELENWFKPLEKLEDLLTAKFSLLWYIPPDCYHCNWKQGGQCVGDDKGKFRCEDANDGIETKQGGNNKAVQIGAGAGAGVGALLMILGIFVLLYCRRRKQSLPTLTLVSKNILPDPSLKQDLGKGSTYFQTPIFTYTELEEATNNFNSSKELGDGGFGTVYHGKLRDGRIVAVKRLYENNFKRVEQFMNEIAILSRIRHQNLVSLYGCTSRHCRELLLVYEFIPNGTIADHLHGQRSKPGFVKWPIRMNIAIESADALAYLHASDIIHRDVKTNNILLDNSFHVKVADFGLSRLFPTDKTHVSTAPQGTPGYVDPEYYQCYQLTDRSDVYSFGVVLIELISSKPAVDVNRHRHDINLANMAITKIQNHALHELVDPHLGFESDYAIRMMITSVAELAFRCLQQEKELRPSMMEVLEVLRGIQSEEYKDRESR